MAGNRWEMQCEFGDRDGEPFKDGGAKGITAISPGKIAMTDINKRRVVICSTDGQQLDSYELQERPHGIAAIPNQDNWLVVVDDSKYVKMFKSNQLAFEFPTVPPCEVDQNDVQLRSVAVDKNGVIVVGDIEREVLTEHSPHNGELLQTVKLPCQAKPYFLAVDDSNRRFAVSNHLGRRLFITNRQGLLQHEVTPTVRGQQGRQLASCGVCCDSSGIYLSVCVRDSDGPGRDTGHLHHYRANGWFQSCLTNTLRFPKGIALTGNGQLAVASECWVQIYRQIV